MAKWNISRLILIVMNHYGNRYIMSSVRPLSMVSSCLMKNNRDGDSRTSECKQDSCQEAFRMLELEELITIIPNRVSLSLASSPGRRLMISSGSGWCWRAWLLTWQP